MAGDESKFSLTAGGTNFCAYSRRDEFPSFPAVGYFMASRQLGKGVKKIREAKESANNRKGWAALDGRCVADDKKH